MMETTTSNNRKNNNELLLIPDTILRRRHDLDNLVRKRKALQEIDEKRGPKKRVLGGTHFYVKKPETFMKRARNRHNALIRYNRIRHKGMQKRASNQPVFMIKTVEHDSEEDDNDEVARSNNNNSKIVMKYQSNSVGANMVFVIRIRDHQATPRPIREILNNKLRLKYLHEGVFVKYNDKMRSMLHAVEPWIMYGKPTSQMIADLIERRGYATSTTPTKSKNKERIPLSDNTVIEDYFRSHSNTEYQHIICKEDMVYEISNVGPAFDVITSQFLYPFQLIDSKTTLERKILKLYDGKDYGDRGDEINEYIQQVL